VEAEGKLIFHAGDLNIWYWEGEPEEENLWQEKTYLEEIRKIKEAVGDRVIDLAFLPLDVRLESHAPDGFLAFLSEIPLKLAVPMHYWGEEQKMRACLDLKEMAAYADRIKVF
jgi:L-ascorbate metabolism protein UlaG (beta-lactamase superfamily)